MVSDKKIVHVFHYISLYKTCHTRCGTILGPRGIIRINPVEVYLVMLHTEYQSSGPYGFRQEDFSMFYPLYKPM